jgi:hypothetical protein
MKIICAWCEKTMGTKSFKDEVSSIPLVTHSICKSCHEKVLLDIRAVGAWDRPTDKAALQTDDPW